MYIFNIIMDYALVHTLKNSYGYVFLQAFVFHRGRLEMVRSSLCEIFKMNQVFSIYTSIDPTLTDSNLRINFNHSNQF